MSALDHLLVPRDVEGYRATAFGFLVPDRQPVRTRPVAVDLFCGAGGFSLGFHQAGWHVAAAVEFDLAASVTYLLNLGGPGTVWHVGPGMDTARRGVVTSGWDANRCADVLPDSGTGWIASPDTPDDEPACEHFYRADVRDITGRMILDDLGMEPGEVGAVIGGPPCQGFSIAGKRDVMDPRNSLVFEFARLVCEIQPRAFVMENVPNIEHMRTPEGIPVLDAVAKALDAGGYGEFEAMRRALGATGGKAVVRNARSVKKAGSLAVADDAQVAEPDLLDTLGDEP